MQPVEQVFPETALLDLLLEVPVGGSDEARIGLDGLVAADPLELALLQHPQHLHLEIRAHVPDLVQEDGAAVGHFEFPLLVRKRTGKGPAAVAEKFALQQALRRRAAVDLDERLAAAGRALVNGPGNHALAGPGLAVQHDRRVADRHFFHDAEDLLHGGALADDLLERDLGRGADGDDLAGRAV